MDDKGHPSATADPRTETLGELIDRRERGRFVGRVSELAFLEACLGNAPPASVVLVHGPAGIGKSMLLRELARRARVAAWDVFVVEGRELPPSPYALEAALSEARASPRPLILIDTYERMTGLDGYLRRELLPSLPGEALVVIAGRGAPDPQWLEGGWEEVAGELELTGLAPADAHGLLDAHGVDHARASAIVAWAEGSPLALALAAETATDDKEWNPAHDAERPEILRSLIRRVVDSELKGERLSALAVAALARVTTPELLAAVLPESDAAAAFERLRTLTFAEPLGDGLALHELVRKALRADFRQRDPDRERELRRRIVDHLYELAQRDEPLVAIEMAHLIENPAIRWGFGWEGSIDYRIDVVRPGDAETIEALMAERGFSEWWEHSKSFVEQAPDRIAVARSKDDSLCGYTIAMSPATAPSFAEADPLLGSWLPHARGELHLGDSVLWRDSVDFTGDPRGRVQAMLGVAGILRSGAPNPRFAYMPINPEMPAAVSFAQELAAVHLPSLDLTTKSIRIECYRIDYGPGGLIAAQRAVVYRELGLPDPRGSAEDPDVVEIVHAALKHFRVPHELARSPLARGETVDARAESVRAILRDAAEQAFGETENEKLLQRVLIRGYLEPGSSHEQTADELHLSRAAYFRRLRAATHRVAEYVAGYSANGGAR
jgi:hypothetical protein